MNFPLIAFPVSPRCWIVVVSFSFVARCLLIASFASLLTYWLFNNMLFTFHVFVCFSGYFLWLISSSIPLWSEKKFEMISAFWNLLRLILCHNRWSTIENIPCALEESVYSTDRGEMLWRYQINPFALMCLLKSPYSCWFSIWKPIHWSQWGVKIPD